ncbi:hypothetical protein P0R31_37605 [Bradyrhizobium yuanmingense]|nr:hypothetical protein [Bradyrhizobium yuanmingense]MDF0522948.1 hypothetical protein [Bradyrhizobium yuanmingense]
MLAVGILLALLSVSFGAGYLTRHVISRRRRAEARIWTAYTQPEWLRPPAANRNDKVPPQGELGEMLARWNQRRRARLEASRTASREGRRS